ncbi:MAG: ROK family protein [Candidatus Pristimantibacillus sp.]
MDKRTHPVPTTKRLIYDLVSNKEMVSKAELLSNLHSISSTTLSRLLDEMTSEGLLLVSGLGASSGGRKPLQYQINPDYGYIFGLEISRMYSTLALFDMQMNVKSITRWRMDEAMAPEPFIQHVQINIKAFLSDHRISTDQIIGIGIGSVGPLDRANGIILKPLHFLANGWLNVPICQLIEERTGFKARLDNGANMALLGEHWALRDNDAQHLLYIHAGAGLRSALMSHGVIVHGSNDMEGAIGQMIIQMDGPRLLDYGNYGALEAFASVQALEKTARAHAKAGRHHLLDMYKVTPEQLNYELVARAMTDGDPYATELFRQSATCLGIGLSNMINMFHPEVVIVGGVLINSADMFFQTTTEIARNNTFYYPDYEPIFTKGNLKEDAIVTGTAIMIRNAFTL